MQGQVTPAPVTNQAMESSLLEGQVHSVYRQLPTALPQLLLREPEPTSESSKAAVNSPQSTTNLGYPAAALPHTEVHRQLRI